MVLSLKTPSLSVPTAAAPPVAAPGKQNAKSQQIALLPPVKNDSPFDVEPERISIGPGEDVYVIVGFTPTALQVQS